MSVWTEEIDPASIPDHVLWAEVGRRRSAKRVNFAGGRPRVMKPCLHCGEMMSGREFWRHKCPLKATASVQHPVGPSASKDGVTP